jgi:hypothetical protein
MQLAKLFQLDAQAMPQRAFRTKFVEQGFRLVESLWRHVFAFEQTAKAALNLGFSKQDETSRPHVRSALRGGQLDKAQFAMRRLSL